MRIFIDLDGVLADWTGAVLRDLAKPADTVINNWDLREIGGTEHVRRNVVMTVEWWENLELFEWSEELVDLCSQRSSVFLLSSPDFIETAHEGKRRWVRKHFPHLAEDLILTKHKHLLSREDTLLIDDYDGNVSSFRSKGQGISMTFPRTWNCARTYANDPLTYVKDHL